MKKYYPRILSTLERDEEFRIRSLGTLNLLFIDLITANPKNLRVLVENLFKFTSERYHKWEEKFDPEHIKTLYMVIKVSFANYSYSWRFS